MAYRNISTAWKTDLKTQFPQNDRVYLDTRLREYGPLTGSAWTNLLTDQETNTPGSHVLGIFQATTNLVSDPEDLTTANWTESNCTATTTKYYVGGYALSKLTASAANAEVYQDITYTSSTAKGFHIICKKGDYDNPGVELYDTDAAAYRLHLEIDFSAQTITETVGEVRHAIWRDDDTVTLFCISTAVTHGNTNRLRLEVDGDGSGADTNYTYFTAIQTHDEAWPIAYNNTSAEQLDYFLEMPDTFTLRVYVKPLLSYDTSATHYIWGWKSGANSTCQLEYNSSDDTFRLRWRDGGTARWLSSAQFDDGSAHTDINQWLVIDCVFNLAGTSYLYINRVLEDSSWSGATDSKTNNFLRLSFGHIDSAGWADTLYAYAILIPDYTATSTDISNDFKNVENEMIYWDFNGQAVGRERFDISKYVMGGISYSNSCENEDGNFSSAQAGFTLNNVYSGTEGCFSDDQYAAFEPESAQFNGTSSQKYLQQDCRIEIESWYGNDFEPYFMGFVQGGFPRSTPNQRWSTVSISCRDYIYKVAHRQTRYATAYDDHKLCDAATESNSLLHDILRIASQKTFYNYATNSSFENATISNSWSVANNATISRYNASATRVFWGTYSCECVYDGTAAGRVTQTIQFDAPVLNVGDTFSFGVYAKTLADTTIECFLYESDSGGINDTTNNDQAITVAENWALVEVTHTITDSDSDRLQIALRCDDAVTIYYDAVWLGYGTEYPKFYPLNDNDGDGAAPEATSSQRDSASYDYLGFDVETYPVTHEYHMVNETINIWDELKRLGDAMVPRYYGLDKTGTCFRFRSAICFEDNIDPPVQSTVTDSDISSVMANLIFAQANRIKVHGIKILEIGSVRLLYELLPNNIPPGTTNLATGEAVKIAVNNGDEFPATPYWADMEED